LFSASAVQGDCKKLAVGHRVKFDLELSWAHSQAARVRVEPPRLGANGKIEAPPDLRYAGFDQAQNVRSYKFDDVTSGQSVRQFVVTVDLELLLKHHVGVQEVPILCLRKLVADLKNSPRSRLHELGSEELRAHVISRAHAVERKRPRRAFGRRRGSPPPLPGKRLVGSG
jgi:hypothetical protein